MQDVRVVRLEPFPDLDDEVVYPRLTERKLEWLEKVMKKKGGERRTFQEGDVLYEHAVRDAPFFVLLTGRAIEDYGSQFSDGGLRLSEAWRWNEMFGQPLQMIDRLVALLEPLQPRGY